MEQHVYISHTFKYALVAAAAVMLVVLFGSKAFAATRTWDGDTNLNWNEATNWDTDTLPLAGDDLVFDTDAVTFSSALNNDFTAGTSFNSVTVSGSGTGPTLEGNSFDLVAGIAGSVFFTINNDLTLSGTQTFQGTTVLFGGDVSLGANDLTLDGSFFTFNGDISGSGNIGTLNNPSVTLVSDNTMTGNVSLASGDILYVCTADALGVGGSHIFASGSKVYFPIGTKDTTTTVNDDFTIGGTGTGPEDYNAAIQFTDLSCGGSGGGGSDPDQPFSPPSLSEKGDVTFSGTVTLSADTNIHAHPATYWASTVAFSDLVAGGNSLNRTSNFGADLVINGTKQATQDNVVTKYEDNQANSQVYIYKGNTVEINGTRNDVAVYAGGILMGTGTVDELVVFGGGTLAPGNSPGCLSSGNLTLAGTFDVEIAGTTVCTEYDQTDVTGSVDVTGGTLNVTFLASFTPADGDEFIIIANDGADAVTGTFSGLAEGDTLTVGTTDFTISYTGGDGNDVVLTAGATAGAPDTGFLLFNLAQPWMFGLAGIAAIAVMFMNREDTIFSARR